MPLALAHARHPQDRLAGGVDAQLAAVGHAEAEDVHVLARPGADGLGEERDADAHELALGPLLLLLATELVVAGHLHGQAHGRLVVAGVVHPARLRRVGELVGLDEVLDPQLGGVHLEVVRQAVDEALHEVHGLGDAERARVGHAAGRLVRVDGRHLAVGRLQVVAAREHPEEPGRVLDRRRGAVEGAVVGQHVRADGEDLAVLGGGDLAAHHVVAREAGAHQVLGAVLHPLHRLADDQRRHDGAHVARVDRHLVAEPAADVGGDDPDLVLRQTRHQRVHRAVRVGGLRRRPEGELAVHLLEVGHAPARLHRGRVHAGVDDVLHRHHLGRLEHRVGGGLVAGLPVEAVVVGLALEVVADDRGIGRERLPHVDDRIESIS